VNKPILKAKKKSKRKWLKLFFLHRYAGLTAAFFAILLSVTGILLNHTEELELDSHNATSSWLLALYGIKSPKINVAYPVDKSWVVEFGGMLYLSEKPLDCTHGLTGAIYTGEVLLVSNQTQVCIFTAQGELIDNLVITNDNTIKKLGVSKGDSTEAVVLVNTLKENFSINADYTELVLIEDANNSVINNAHWSSATAPPEGLEKLLISTDKGKGLPWERVILDLHSGRIFTLAGVYFMDLVAVLLIFLSVTGVLMWVKRGKARRKMV
jgi:acyl carrier protein